MLSFKALSLQENPPYTNLSLVATNNDAKTPSEVVADEMDRRSTQLAHGLGVGIREPILGENPRFGGNGDLSTYTTWYFLKGCNILELLLANIGMIIAILYYLLIQNKVTNHCNG